jgi:hypothetical protein
MDEFRAGELPYTQFVQALDLFIRIYVERPIGIENFAVMIYNRAKIPLDEMIGYEVTKREAFDSQLIVEYFEIGLSRL